MTLTGLAAADALMHILQPPTGEWFVVILPDGKRYGGFCSEAYALAVIRLAGWSGAVVRREEGADNAGYEPDMNKCQCCGGESLPIHGCPANEELGDGKKRCNCCDECCRECGMSI